MNLGVLASAASHAEIKSVALWVPSMMCLGSCGAAIEAALTALPDTTLAVRHVLNAMSLKQAIDIPQRIVHCHTSSAVELVLKKLDDIGFDLPEKPHAS